MHSTPVDSFTLDMCIAAYRAKLRKERTLGFQVPETIMKAWKEGIFTKSYLRSFLTFCLRTTMDEWIQRIEHCIKKNRDPWQINGKCAHDLCKSLNEWCSSDQIDQLWGNACQLFGHNDAIPKGLKDAEKLRIAREQMVIGIREAMRHKGKGE